jgi:hypothetical protein
MIRYLWQFCTASVGNVAASGAGRDKMGAAAGVF